MNKRNLKPRIRPDATFDLRSALINTFENTIKQVDPVYISCLNCINFKEKEELCGLVNQRPPARVIAYGCPRWEDVDEIPF